jgi:hypothetical protein
MRDPFGGDKTSGVLFANIVDILDSALRNVPRAKR